MGSDLTWRPRINLQQLDADIFYMLTDYLSLYDVISLRQTHDSIRRTLDDDHIAWKIVKTFAPSSYEAKLLREYQISRQDAVSRLDQRYTALHTAQPVSAGFVGCGSSFACKDGVLCYLTGHTIQVVDLYDATDGRRQINLRRVLDHKSPIGVAEDLWYTAKVVSYAEDVLVLHIANRSIKATILIAVSTGKSLHESRRMMGVITPDPAGRRQRQVMVRNTADYICYGTRLSSCSERPRTWKIWTYRLNSIGAPITATETEPVRLLNFTGSDIGEQVAFEIYGVYFYAVTHDTFVTVSGDYESVYKYAKFPLDNAVQDALETGQAFRRNHTLHGPLGRTSMSIQIHEGEENSTPYIVECRQERLTRTKKEFRSFYNTPMDFSSSRSELQFTTYAGSYSPSAVFSEQAALNSSGRCKTGFEAQFTAYNLSTDTFIDSIEDPSCCLDDTHKMRSQPCLRLRMSSRRPAPYSYFSTPPHASVPLAVPTFDPNNRRNVFMTYGNDNGESAVDPTVENRFCTNQHRTEPIRYWPPRRTSGASLRDSEASCSKVLHDVLNPPIGPQARLDALRLDAKRRMVEGFFDGHVLVYMVRNAKGTKSGTEAQDEGAIVMVSFDSKIMLRGGLSWRKDLCKTAHGAGGSSHTQHEAVDAEQLRRGERQGGFRGNIADPVTQQHESRDSGSEVDGILKVQDASAHWHVPEQDVDMSCWDQELREPGRWDDDDWD